MCCYVAHAWIILLHITLRSGTLEKVVSSEVGLYLVILVLSHFCTVV
jgi:hypothetical protein